MIANHPPIPPYYVYPYNDNDYQSEEYFAYDPLDRLTFNGRMNIKHMPFSFGNISYDLVVPETDTMMYMNYTGVKMTANSAVGDFIYEAPQPHAVSEVLPINDSVISADQCDITYNVFNKTHTINEAGKRYTIDYYPNQQRAMTTYTVNNTEQEKKIYCGREYEYNLTTNTQYNYIYVGDMPIALYVQGDTNAMYTLHTNYIGSIEKISDKNGNVVDSMSYTPFGQRRLFSDWSKTDTATHFIDRGFTGQQHLDNFALINFNGRMYDPVLAHFLSPDPYIQSPENPLNYNRYSYCLFSPLQYVDPTGFFIDWYRDSENNIRWTDFTSKKDFESSGIKGTYLGKTYLDLENNLYYSLFGQIVSANSKNGKITQKIDEAFINYANYLSESKNNNLNNNPFDAEWHAPIHNSTDFSNIIPFNGNFFTTSENRHYPNEMGKYANKADIHFMVTKMNMKGRFESFYTGKDLSRITGNNGQPPISGHLLKINSIESGKSIIILRFDNRTSIESIQNMFYKLFPNIK